MLLLCTTTLPLTAAVPVAVAMDSSPTCLSFAGRQLKLDTRDDAEEMASLIESYDQLVSLELRGNTIGVDAGDRIAQALSKHPELKFALWSDMFTGRLRPEIPPILRSLCSSMMNAGTRLTELDLSDNAFGPVGAEGIQEFLSSPAAYELEVLRLNNNGLGVGGVTVADSLWKCAESARAQGRKLRLKTFVAGRNRLEVPGARALARAFMAIGTLEEITVPQNGITAAGIDALAQSFAYNPNLRVINLNDNTCTARGAIALSLVLSELPALESLDLGDTLCRANGAFAIFCVLADNPFPNLKYVGLDSNEVPASTVGDMVSIWKSRGKQAMLKLAGNNCGGDFEDIAELIHELGAGEVVDVGDEDDDQGTLSDESIDEEEGEYDEVINVEDEDAVALDSSPTCLSFAGRQLKLDTRDDAEEMASLIESYDQLVSLELRGNTIGVDAGDRIAQALSKHPELKFALWSDMFTGRLRPEIPPILRSLCSSMMNAGTRLTELDLSDNAFGPVGAEGIQEFLSSPAAYELEVLRLNNNGLGVGGVTVADSLWKCAESARAQGRKLRLKTFVAGRNRLEVPGARALARAFMAIGTLEEITVPQNGITAAGIDALAQSFAYNPNLRVINLNDNTCTARGANALTLVLSELPALESLDLGDTLCRANGAFAIFCVLADNPFPNLKYVGLDSNEVPASTVRDMVSIWKSRGKQAMLKLAGNNCGGDFEDIADLIHELGASGLIDIGEQSDDEGTLSDVDSGNGEVEESDSEGEGAGDAIRREETAEKTEEEEEDEMPELHSPPDSEDVGEEGAGDEPPALDRLNLQDESIDDEEGEYDEDEEFDEEDEEDYEEDEDETDDEENDENLPSLQPTLPASRAPFVPPVQSWSLKDFLTSPRSAPLSAWAVKPSDLIIQLDGSEKAATGSRDQTETARLILSILRVITVEPTAATIALNVADAIMQEVEKTRRRPIDSSVQVINHIIAHVDSTFRVEERLVPEGSVSRAAVEQLLRGLLQKGRLQPAKDTIKHHFPAAAEASAPLSFSFAPQRNIGPSFWKK